jgi:hypothetical protein
VDLKKGISIRIGGERTKNNTLPLDVLLSLASYLKTLITEGAKSGLSNETSIKLDNFKIELSGFKIGSAVPQFSFTHEYQLAVGVDVKEQQRLVNDKLCKVLSISSNGNFSELNEEFSIPEHRNAVVRSLYGFINSVGNAPLSVVDDDLQPEFEMQKFTKNAMDSILVDIEDSKKEELKPKSILRLAQIVDTGKRGPKKVVKTYGSKIRPTFDPEVITCKNTQYELRYPLRSKIIESEGKVIIENEQLGIYSYGDSIDEAEEMFCDEFDYLYTRYNELDNSKLNSAANFIKIYLNQIVKKHG